MERRTAVSFLLQFDLKAFQDYNLYLKMQLNNPTDFKQSEFILILILHLFTSSQQSKKMRNWFSMKLENCRRFFLKE